MSTLPALSENDKAVLQSIFNPSEPFGENEEDDEVSSEFFDIESHGDETLQKIELEAINCAELGKFDESLKLFSDCLELFPNRPATYNNRGQVYLMKGDLQSSLSDLNKALELCGERGKVARQVFCQKGIIYTKNKENDLALEQFRKAAKLGSVFAKEQLVKMNPYAALCNQMLSQVIPAMK